LNSHLDLKTLGTTTFSPCATPNQMLFRLNPDIPIRDALEHASNLLCCAQKLSLDAAMESDGQRFAWAAHYLCEMGKAVIDEVSVAMLRGDAVYQSPVMADATASRE